MSEIKCGGNCCEEFSTSLSPGEWHRWASAIRWGKKTRKDDRGRIWDIGDAEMQTEALKISSMLRVVKVIKSEPVIQQGINGRYKYTCKHFDKTTRLCTNYENRPSMCKDYPEYEGRNSEHVCHIQGCLINCASKNENNS